jgi:hypothetical protein
LPNSWWRWRNWKISRQPPASADVLPEGRLKILETTA